MASTGSCLRAWRFSLLSLRSNLLVHVQAAHELNILHRVFSLSKATCERGFAAMEESHQKVIDELQRKHQRELENLHEEKERLLAEETAATIAGKLHAQSNNYWSH